MTSHYKHLLDQIAVNGENTAKWSAAAKEYFQTFIHAEPILKHFSDNITIVLHGSTTQNIDDAHSDLDFWLVLDDPESQKYRSISEQNFIPVEINSKKGHLNPLRISHLDRCFDNEIDMVLINELISSIVIVDKKNAFQKYQKLAAQPLNDSVRHAYFFNNYVEMRASHRSCDNPMERGDRFAVLFSAMQTIRYALRAAFVLDRVPYPYEKWLCVQANFHETPKSLLENVDKIITEMQTNPAALLGPEKENRISQELRAIRAKLSAKAKQSGIDALWLEKWWRYVDRSREIIAEVRWADG
ncbi:MAG: DUF4037 domain-containing protein [bacterium]